MTIFFQQIFRMQAQITLLTSPSSDGGIGPGGSGGGGNG